MLNIQIRKVTASDVLALQEISRQTFTETFAAVNTAENLSSYLSEQLSLPMLQQEINQPDSEFYFAESLGQILGYLKLNFHAAQTEIKDPDAMEIERIYVLKAFQGQKVGKLLFDLALHSARSINASYIWLGVWEKNIKAIQFYKKYGFTEFDRHIFRLGDDEQTDIMMKLNLKTLTLTPQED